MKKQYLSILLLAVIGLFGNSSVQALPPVTDGLLVNWDADNVVSAAGKIETMVDQSGNNFDAKKGAWWNPGDVNDYRPALVTNALNGHSVARFDGTDFLQYYDPNDPNDPNWIDARNYTWFTVYNVTNATANPTYSYLNSVLISSYNDVDQITPGNQATVSAWGNRSAGQETEVFATASDPTQISMERIWYPTPIATGFAGVKGWRVVCGMWNAAQAVDGQLDGYVNGGNMAADYPSPQPATTNYLRGHLGTFVGRTSYWTGSVTLDNAGAFEGDIAEIIIYKRGLNKVEIEAVTNYLRQKYNLDMPPVSVTKNLFARWNADNVRIANAPFSPKVNTCWNQAGSHNFELKWHSWIPFNTAYDTSPDVITNVLNGHSVFRFDKHEFLTCWAATDLLNTIPDGFDNPATVQNLSWAIVYKVADDYTDPNYALLSVCWEDCNSASGPATTAWPAYGSLVMNDVLTTGAVGPDGILRGEQHPEPFGWRVVTGVWNPSSTIDGDVDGYSAGMKGLPDPAVGDFGTTTYLGESDDPVYKFGWHSTTVGVRNWYYGSIDNPDFPDDPNGMWFKGDVAEIMVWNGGLTPEEQNEVGKWLAAKYNITYTDCKVVSGNADINRDCYVDEEDVSLIAKHWLSTDTNTDIFPDNIINFKDHAKMALKWLDCFNPEDTNCQ